MHTAYASPTYQNLSFADAKYSDTHNDAPEL